MTKLKVNKRNDMITGRACFSLMENRVFLYGVSLINPKNEDFPLTYKIDVARFAKMFDLSVNRLYSELKNDILYKMRKRSMTVRKQGEHGYFNRVFNIIQYADYEDNSGYLKITFDAESKPFLHNLTENYTSYYIDCVSKFKSTYSIRFFEWCVMRLKQNKGERVTLELTLDEIRERLDLKDKYPRYCDLKTKVIKKALDEIEAYKE
jgi:plasmid replication initiation protein